MANLETQENQISLVDWEEWRESPVTKAVFRRFPLKAMDSLKDQWAHSNFMGEGNRDEVLLLNAAALGEYKAYERLVELEYEQLMEIMQDD